MPIVLSSVPVVRVLNGDCREVLKTLPDGSVNCCVTSPPYFGLRDYGTAKWEGGDPACQHSCGGQVQDSKAPGAISSGVRPGCDASMCRKCGARRVDSQIGLEPTPEAYVAEMVAVFREVRRVLRDDGTLWLNLGDSYNSLGGVHAGRSDNQTGVGAGQRQWREGSARADGQVRSDGMSRRNRDGTHAPGLKPKDLIGIPWRVAFALQADGWYLRQDIIWHKPNPMPESVTDRCTKAHEYLFLLSKSERYYFDATRRCRSLRQCSARAVLGSKKRWPSLATTNRWRPAVHRQGCYARAVMRHRNPQPPLRLDRRHPALQGRALRHIPARP
jgi:DNA modification methylase